MDQFSGTGHSHNRGSKMRGQITWTSSRGAVRQDLRVACQLPLRWMVSAYRHHREHLYYGLLPLRFRLQALVRDRTVGSVAGLVIRCPHATVNATASIS